MEPEIIKRDGARCQKIAEELDQNGPYGLVWFHDHACVWTKYLDTKITVWIADLVDAKGLYVASAVRDDERYAYLTHTVGALWFNLNVVRARGGFVALLTATREGRDQVSANSVHTDLASARRWLKMALADLL